MLDKSSVNVDFNYCSNLMTIVIIIIIVTIMSVSDTSVNLSAVSN